jgi:hypothetical protein
VLIRARPRADVADAHADVVDALRAYLDCARELRTACASPEAGRVEPAARDLDRARERLHAAQAAVVERLG